MRLLTLCAAVLAAAAIVAAQVRAQAAVEKRNFSISRLRPAADAEGILDVEWAGVPAEGSFDVALWPSFANDPLVLTRLAGGEEQERVGDLVGARVDLDLVAAYTPSDWLQIAGGSRLVLYQDRPRRIWGMAGETETLDTGVGDFRLGAKAQILAASERGVGLALILSSKIPVSRRGGYLGETRATLEPEVAIGRQIRRVRIGANVAYVKRKHVKLINVRVDDEVLYRLGAAYRFAPGLSLAGSVSGGFRAKTPFKKANETPLELLVGASYDLPRSLQAFVGTGYGLTNAYGTPDFRLFGGVRLAMRGQEPDGVDVAPVLPRPEPPVAAPAVLDRDGDGLDDPEDACPTEAEDPDNFDDADGCPDPDNDEDGIRDFDDTCPLEAEDQDEFEDEDGCPDADNDGDGVLDVDDVCPLEAEDRDEFKDEDGCPDLDDDGDGLLDTEDRCPLQPGPAATAGCPDFDRDGDAVVDRLDNCPDEAGRIEFAGCARRQLVRLTEEKIEISQKVFFVTGKATIRTRSFALLDNIVAVLAAHPELEKVRIEGHTDDRGSDAYNMRLSEERAASVRQYLVEHGIEPDLLEAIGFGEARPIANNRTRRGRRLNRRVEFTIQR